MGTTVTCPTFRYNPAVIAEAFATLDSLAPGRIFLGIGSGEALMNKRPRVRGQNGPSVPNGLSKLPTSSARCGQANKLLIRGIQGGLRPGRRK